MIIEIINSSQAMLALRPAWDEFLASPEVRHNIYQSAGMVDILLTKKGADSSPFVMVVRDRDDIIALVPMFVERVSHPLKFGALKLLNLPVRRLVLIGDDICAVDDDRRQEIYRAVFAELGRHTGEFDFLLLHSMTLETGVHAFLSNQPSTADARLHFNRDEAQISRGIELPESFEDYVAAMKYKTRYNLKRRRKKLEEAAEGELDLEEITAPEQVAGFFDAVQAVFAKSWQSRVLGDRWRNKEQTVSAACGIAEHGWFRSFLLKMHGEPVAFAMGYQYNGVFSLEEIAYDNALSKLGPGNVMTFALVEALLQHDRPRCVDFGHGDNEYKRILGNTERMAVTASVLFRGGWKGRAVMFLQMLLTRLYHASMWLLRALGLEEAIKKRLKHGR